MTRTMSSSMHWFSCETKQVLPEVYLEERNYIRSFDKAYYIQSWAALLPLIPNLV